MSHAYQIVHEVLDNYRGLPVKLASITDKSTEWYASHGREPKTDNPTMTGNVSPVTHYLRFCRLYEAAEPGAGQMLNNRVHAELNDEFSDQSLTTVQQQDIHTNIIREGCDVSVWLANYDLSKASRNDLLHFEKDCAEAIDALIAAKGRANALRRQMARERVFATNGAAK